MVDDTGQVSRSAAHVYDEFFVPALFGGWPPEVLKAARISKDSTVLDVACGSGVLALAAKEAVGPHGHVVGLDLNEAMLDVGRAKSRDIEWCAARAESLPFESERFHAVVSQFGLMFFEDQTGSVQEMWRVLRPGGRLVVAVWDALEHAPGYRQVTGLLERLFGASVANVLRAPYSLGDANRLRTIFIEATGHEPLVRPVHGVARYPSIRDWMHVDVRGWTLADIIDDAGFERLVSAAEAELEPLVGPDGAVEFAHPALFVEASKP